MTIQDLAREASSYFERAYRVDGDEDSAYVRTKDGTPEWVRDLVQSAHGEMFPDDWRYDQIENALDHIADSDDPEDSRHEFADNAVDVYNAARFAWLASNIDRQYYCDEAQNEFGIDPDATITDRIGLGQYFEADEVYGLTLQALGARWTDVQQGDDDD